MPNLILSRREGETIVINDKITITLLEVDGKTIRLTHLAWFLSQGVREGARHDDTT